MLLTQPHEEFQGDHRVISLCWWVCHMRYRYSTHWLWVTALIIFVCPAMCADTSVLSLRSLYAVNEFRAIADPSRSMILMLVID